MSIRRCDHRLRFEDLGLFQDNKWSSALVHAPFASGKTSYIPFLAMHYGPLHKVVVIFPSIVTLQSFVRGCRESGFEEIGEFSSQANTVKTIWNLKKCERPTNIICTTAGCYNFLLDHKNFVADYIIFDECHKSDMLTDLAILRTMKKKLKMIFMTATFDPEEAQHLKRYMTGDGGIHRVFRSSLDPPYPVEFFDCNGRPLNENVQPRRPLDVPNHSEFKKRLTARLVELRNRNATPTFIIFVDGMAMLRVASAAVNLVFPGLPIRPIHSKFSTPYIGTEGGETGLNIQNLTDVFDSCHIKTVDKYNIMGITSLFEGLENRHSMAQRGGRVGRNGPGRVTFMLTSEEVAWIRHSAVDHRPKSVDFENAALFHTREGDEVNELVHLLHPVEPADFVLVKVVLRNAGFLNYHTCRVSVWGVFAASFPYLDPKSATAIGLAVIKAQRSFNKSAFCYKQFDTMGFSNHWAQAEAFLMYYEMKNTKNQNRRRQLN
uniref:Helicase ATP-binding domain-containing protein n=1 Tax=Panagrolaimus sp. PS1159 TaxID=55785 RepID=A0AC35FEM6_9BILA